MMSGNLYERLMFIQSRSCIHWAKPLNLQDSWELEVSKLSRFYLKSKENEQQNA